MRKTQRWLPIPWGVYGSVLAVIFCGIGVYALLHPEDGPSVRLAIPLYVVAVYWVVACLVNRRTAGVKPQGIWVLVWPVPVLLPRRISREKIRHCYVRRVSVIDEGTELETHFSTRVETLAGHLIGVCDYQKTEADAAGVAQEVAGILNQAPGGKRIEIFEVGQSPTRAEAWRIVLRGLFWLMILLVAIFLGALWDLEYDRARG